MKLERITEGSHAVPFDGRGRTSPAEQLLISERTILLCEAAMFFRGCGQREAARRIRERLSIYRAGRWRRDCIEATCPARCRGLNMVLWKLLKVRDHVPSEMTIRRALFVNHQP